MASIFDKKGIMVASGFDLQAESPLDSRYVVADVTERDRLVTEHAAYEGLRVYVKALKQVQFWNGTSWIVLGADTSADLTAIKTKLGTVAEGATKVEASTVNGKIKINGTETTVYTLPADLLNNTIVGVSCDDTNGIFTFTKADGSKVTVDTLLEKVVTNFNYDAATESLVLTLEDGTTKSIDMSAFINIYTAKAPVAGDTVEVTITDGVISAGVRAASITKAMLVTAVQNVLDSVANKVDKVTGKGLSTEDFTTPLKTKLDSLRKVESSATNGKIKIDGAETTVYTHPTGDGYAHIPAGGTEGQVLSKTASGYEFKDSPKGVRYGASVPTDMKEGELFVLVSASGV